MAIDNVLIIKKTVRACFLVNFFLYYLVKKLGLVTSSSVTIFKKYLKDRSNGLHHRHLIAYK